MKKYCLTKLNNLCIINTGNDNSTNVVLLRYSFNKPLARHKQNGLFFIYVVAYQPSSYKEL